MSDELDIDYTVDAVLPEDPEEAKRRVEWHARMARHYTAQLAEETAAFQREIDRLKAEIEMRKRTVEARVRWHTDPIESYHRMRQEQDPDYRTLRMPHGTSKITVPKKPVVSLGDMSDDEDAAVAWLIEQHPQLLKLPGIATIRSLVDVKEVDEGEDITGLAVFDKETGEVLRFLTADVPDKTYKFTPEEGTPL